MAYDWLNPTRTGLLFFDMLNSSLDIFETAHKAELDQMALYTSVESVVKNAIALRNVADEVGIPVFFARADHRPDGKDAARLYSDTDLFLRPLKDPENDRFEGRHFFTTGTSGSAVIPELGLTEQDYLIPKLRWSAFFQTKLELSLRSRGIDTLVISGGALEVGVVSTCYSARDLDFNLVLARDACLALEPSAGELMMDHLFPRFARIRSTEQVLGMIRSGAKM